MASYTEKLNLLKKNPVTDGADTFNIETMMNENWDKIDGFSAFLEASIAPPYSASSAYAVGAWCTNYGKLYQCTTPIGPGGEAWNASHWTAKNATDLAKDAVKTFVRPNLLDNWYFVGGGSQQGGGQFPINQRGETSYPTSYNYTIDRWKNYETGLSVQSDCVTISAGSALYLRWLQTIENPKKLNGKTLTASVMYKTASSTARLSVHSPNSSFGKEFTLPSSPNSYNVAWMVFVVPANKFTDSSTVNFQIYPQNTGESNQSISVVAVKLELGDTQTLAHQENGAWVLNEIPNFETELAKCQRYYINIKHPSNTDGLYLVGNAFSSQKAVLFLPLPVNMRTLPVASNALISNAKQNGTTLATKPTIAVGGFYPNGITLIATGTLTANADLTVCDLRIELSADL